MANYKEEVFAIKELVDKAKSEKIRLSERLRGIKDEIEKKESQLKALGIEPGDLDAFLVKEENLIKEELALCRKILKAN